MSNSAITFHNLGVVQAPGALAVPIFAHARQSPPTLAAAPCARLRERGSTLCLCNTDHPAGPRIRKQDPWELEGHGQYVPPRLPPPQASISYATDGISYATIFISELGVSLFALFALMVHFFREPTHGPRNKFADCWDLFFYCSS